jgi:hypothetical protein
MIQGRKTDDIRYRTDPTHARKPRKNERDKAALPSDNEYADGRAVPAMRIRQRPDFLRTYPKMKPDGLSRDHYVGYDMAAEDRGVFGVGRGRSFSFASTGAGRRGARGASRSWN